MPGHPPLSPPDYYGLLSMALALVQPCRDVARLVLVGESLPQVFLGHNGARDELVKAGDEVGRGLDARTGLSLFMCLSNTAPGVRDFNVQRSTLSVRRSSPSRNQGGQGSDRSRSTDFKSPKYAEI
jgi:hypothetical protein